MLLPVLNALLYIIYFECFSDLECFYYILLFLSFFAMIFVTLTAMRNIYILVATDE